MQIFSWDKNEFNFVLVTWYLQLELFIIYIYECSIFTIKKLQLKGQ